MKGVLFAATTPTEYKDGDREAGGHIFSLSFNNGNLDKYAPVNAKGETPVSSQTHRQSSLLTMPSVPQGPGLFSIHYSAVKKRHTDTGTPKHTYRALLLLTMTV